MDAPGNVKKKKPGCHEVVEMKIGAAFERVGRFVSRHPFKVVVGVIMLNGLLGIGMLKMEQDIDVSRVYTPMNSQASKDEQTILEIFPDTSATDFFGYQLTIQPQYASVYVKPTAGDVLNLPFLNEVSKLLNTIENVTSMYENHAVNFSTLCAKNNRRCVVDGEIFTTPFFKACVTADNVTFPIFSNENGVPINLKPLLGGTVSNGTHVLKASHLKLQFNLRSESLHWIQRAHVWQDKFTDTMKTYSNKNFDVAFAHTESLGKELNANIGGDIALFSVTFTLMITFACAVTYPSSNNCVGNRVIMGILGVLAAGLGIIASFGLVSACGMSFVSIVGNSPFLILGIGVDDMFILLSGLAEAGFAGSIELRIGRLMRVSGVAITITSLTNVLAFASGATSTFKSVRNFCVYTGVAVIFCYINQAFFFTSCLAINEKRIDGSRHALCCCKKVRSSGAYRARNRSKVKIFCCGGHKPKSILDVQSHFERFPQWLLPKVISNLPIKICILLGFCTYLGAAIWGVLNLQQGLIRKDLVSENSYFYKYSTWEDEYFSVNVPIAFVLSKPVTYTSQSVKQNIPYMLSQISKNQFMTNNRISWLDQYISSPHYIVNCTEQQFIQKLQTNFLNDPRYMRFKNDVKISTDKTAIEASRFYVFTEEIRRSQDSGKMMLEMRDIVSKFADLNVISFSPPFIFYEQYVAILPQTLQTLGTSIAAVFLVTIFFMPHPLMLFFILFTLCMIMVGIIGFMQHWGLTLSSVTMIHLIMSVGFSVDFTAHICHAFMVAAGNDRKERALAALENAGTPIFNGAISSIIGILMLSLAKSYIFKSFFKVMFLVILFGLCHSVLFLPVVLSLIGPKKNGIQPVKRVFVTPGKISYNGNSSLSALEGRTRHLNSALQRKVTDILTRNPDAAVIYNGRSLTVVPSK